MDSSFAFSPIGLVHCASRYRYEAARQGVYSEGNEGVIELQPGHGYETALEDLSGFERIWVLFVFHLNETWRPKVTPPLTGIKKRIGVFATRSPHRPNRIGMSCVELVKIEGLKIYIRNHDLLDLTPVLDLKPYIPSADAFPSSKAGWRDEVDASEIPVDFTADALEKFAFIKEIAGRDLTHFCKVQLAHDPVSPDRKRIISYSDGSYTIGCRTWKIAYTVDEQGVHVYDVHSNYLPEELLPDADDRYQDKDQHRRFLEKYS
ncbi:MAG: tRNA (N6-threonylcarbamoyladenosine(37)-N6)-methyltransferase TrmO [Lentisphaeria bacterium]|nr:tRNA (N6-threonylcarbamoyladenosine(37)-N6)-methyltransferase TrmO [Lentisphaeria bacterium]